MLRLGFILLALITVNGNIYAVEVKCLDRELAKIQELIPGVNANEITLNNYLSAESIRGEDDGGFYKGMKFTFKEYEVSVVRGQIDSIRITSSSMLWAGKVTLGMGRDKIEDILSAYRVYKGNESSQYLVCSDEGDVYAVLYFNQNQLMNMEISIERP